MKDLLNKILVLDNGQEVYGPTSERIAGTISAIHPDDVMDAVKQGDVAVLVIDATKHTDFAAEHIDDIQKLLVPPILIAITPKDTECIKRMQALGINIIFTKPFNIMVMIAKITKLIGR